jgi:hypothetical protein
MDCNQIPKEMAEAMLVEAAREVKPPLLLNLD